VTTNQLKLCVEKCSYLSWWNSLPWLFLYRQELEHRKSYKYLGFLITAMGIDFSTHLKKRIQAAVRKASWLGIKSDAWGVSHRLRVYKQFLAPMFEYGAPLVWAWAKEDAANRSHFNASATGVKELMAWIGNYSGGRHRVTANLCGLLLVQDRFQHLHTTYHHVLKQMTITNPLGGLVSQAHPQSRNHAFLQGLSEDVL